MTDPCCDPNCQRICCPTYHARASAIRRGAQEGTAAGSKGPVKWTGYLNAPTGTNGMSLGDSALLSRAEIDSLERQYAASLAHQQSRVVAHLERTVEALSLRIDSLRVDACRGRHCNDDHEKGPR